MKAQPKKHPQKPLTRSALRRQRERKQRYKTILNAAETLFAKNGYHQTNMEQIADLAEVSVGTVYFYFKNKADLLVHLLEAIGIQLRKLLGEEFKRSKSTLEGFKAAGMVFFQQFCTQYPQKVSIIFREAVGQSAEVETCRQRIFDLLTGDIKHALTRIYKDYEIDSNSSRAIEVMAVCVIGIYERVGYHYLLSQTVNNDIKIVGQDAVNFIVGGVEKLIQN